MGSLVKKVAPSVPVVSHCHATGLRQMELCPHLAAEVAGGCARNDRFVVLHEIHRTELARALDVDPDRVTVIGAGYREDLFRHGRRSTGDPPRVLYVGKYSKAKGLPWLLDAFAQIITTRPEVELHVAGSGSGTCT